MKDCTTCKYGYKDEQLGIPMCHHPKRFSEDCVDFNMHEEKEAKESEKPMNRKGLDVTDFCKPIDPDIAQCIADHSWEMLGEDGEPVPNDLEEAAWDCVLDSVDVNNPVLLPKYKELLTYLFIAGAKWDRQQMMKRAVEGEVCGDNAKLWVCNNPPSFILDKFKDGDKVKLIFIKKN